MDTDVRQIEREVGRVRKHHPHRPEPCEECCDALRTLQRYYDLPFLEGCLGSESAEFDDWLVLTESAIQSSIEWTREWLSQIGQPPATAAVGVTRSAEAERDARATGRSGRLLGASTLVAREKHRSLKVSVPFLFATVAMLGTSFALARSALVQQVPKPTEPPVAPGYPLSPEIVEPPGPPIVFAPVVGEKDYSMSSYELQKTHLYVEMGLGLLPDDRGTHEPAYADFDMDGDEDVLYPLDGKGIDPKEVALYPNDGSDHFTRADFLEGDIPMVVHAQNAIVGDFNRDGRPDVFISDIREPEPTRDLVVYSTPTGLTYWADEGPHVQNTYAAASADVDGDDDLDIVVAGWPPYFLGSDGPEDHPTTIFWGDGTGSYTSSQRVVLPAGEPNEIVLDLDCEDLDGDGDIDCFADDRALRLVWLNDGTGILERLVCDDCW